MKAERFLLTILGAVLLGLCAGASAMAVDSRPPLPEALDAMKPGVFMSVQTVTVPAWTDNASNYYYAFQSRLKKPKCGFIFYPGGLVDPRAYAPSMREIAEAGYLAIIVKMPSDLAIIATERATEVMAMYPDIEQWVIGGHSLGGVCACMYVYNHPDAMQGLVLWAGYPSDTMPIASYGGKVLSIYGSNDGGAQDMVDTKYLLPPDTLFIVIQGGNHTFCGWYGDNESYVQPGDGVATISHEDEQEQLDSATLDLLNEVSGKAPSPCPVVSLVGSSDPAVAALRAFRDKTLARSFVGLKIIQIYYDNAESITAALDRSPVLRAIARLAIRSAAAAVGKQ